MRNILQTRTFTYLALLVLSTACNRPVKNETTIDHPKLIKTIGSPAYGNVQCSLQDKAGNIWFGTTENGLYKYDGKSFTRFLVAEGLNSNSIYCLLQDTDGEIWIGTDAGLNRYDPSSSPSTNGKIFSEVKLPVPPNPAPNKEDPYYNSSWVYSMMQAKDGKLWVVTRGGVYVYDGTSFTTFHVSELSKDILDGDFKPERILEDKAGNIWFGGRANEGVYRYDGKSITNLKLAELFQDGPKPKPHTWGWPQVQDKNGNIWFGNWGGAYRYDPSTSLRTGSNSFTSFTKKDGLHGGVTRILEDKKGNLWLGGDASAGLTRYDGKSFARFTTKDGLINDSIWSILEDTNGNFWIGTRETGLSRFDGKTFITYSEYKQ